MYIYLLGADESLVPVQGKAVRGSQSTPTDAQLHQPGHCPCADMEKPQTTHPGITTACLTLQSTFHNTVYDMSLEVVQ